MKLNLAQKVGIGIVTVIIVLYAMFLILPYCLNAFANSYIPEINKIIEQSTGLKSEIQNIRILTTPKLSVGLGVKKFNIFTPDNKTILDANNFEIKMSLMPLLARKIELDKIQLGNIDVSLNLNSDGSFELEKYLPKTENTKTETEQEQVTELPFGLKLSNKMPDIIIGEYKVTFTDLKTKKNYLTKGNKIKITDFVLDKSVNIVLDNKVILDNREQITCNIKLRNKIMPDINLHDMVFSPQETKEKKQEDTQINILSILKEMHKQQLTANIIADAKLNKNGSHKGYINIDKLSIALVGYVLPESNAKINFNGNKMYVNSELYTAKNEKSTINGYINTHKYDTFETNITSNANLSNIIKIVNSFAMACNISDLQTLSAEGKIDANFNIKSAKNKITSNGYFKIPSANISYKLYNLNVTNIIADILLNDNNVDIKNIGFSILNQPSKIYGKIKSNLDSDLHLSIQNLDLKKLLISLNFADILKDNTINSGNISVYADATGNLKNIILKAKVAIGNINVKNIPSNTVLQITQADIDLNMKNNTYSGEVLAVGTKAINPCATINAPRIISKISADTITLEPTNVSIDKINLNISGKIQDYLKEKISINFLTTQDIKSSLSGQIDMKKQNLNLLFSAPQKSTIVIPMFNKSKMTFSGETKITGNMLNPILTGNFDIPQLSIPEIPVNMDNLTVKLHGNILNGKCTAQKFASNGIVAENISSDFAMKGENFYLNNLKGNAFDGNFAGNIIYNLSNAKTSVKFTGKNMNAEKAVYGSCGIKNALTGTLNFDTKINLRVLDYNAMIKSMTGNFDFKISNGSFGKIGRLENYLQAANIMSNSVLKNTVQALSSVTAVKDTANFDYIDGNINFANGWANLSSVKSTGKTLAYYVTGRYNILNGTTNMVILGRLDGNVVALLGPLGDLSLDKLLSYIPKFGSLTSSVAKQLTSNPKAENVNKLPALSGGSKNYKDFKVEFNGGAESSSSVKSFKWLTNVDTSAIDKTQSTNIQTSVNTVKKAVNTDIQTTVDTIRTQQKYLKNSADELKNTADELKNLFKF